MDIKKHARTHQIKKLSKYLFKMLQGMRFVLFLGWPAIFFFAFFAEGMINIGEASILIETLDVFPKIFILAIFSTGLMLMLSINHHFKELMLHFSHGDVFSDEVIKHARGALKSGVFYFCLWIFQKIIGWIFIETSSPIFDIPSIADFIIACTIFGMMYTLLWTLEIGNDLNQESEQTI